MTSIEYPEFIAIKKKKKVKMMFLWCGGRKRESTLACTDEEETIRGDRTVEEIDHWARVAMAHKRNRHLFLVHLPKRLI